MVKPNFIWFKFALLWSLSDYVNQCLGVCLIHSILSWESNLDTLGHDVRLRRDWIQISGNSIK